MPNGSYTTKSGSSVAPAKAELHADIASKAACGSDDSSFDFNFLGLAVHLLDDAVNLRQNRWNVADDDRVGTFIGNDVAALAQELLERQQEILGMSVAEEARDADLIDCQCFGIDLSAAILCFFAKSVDGCDGRTLPSS